MGANSPDVTPTLEKVAEQEAMKDMARGILGAAKSIQGEMNLSKEPRGVNFAWTFFANDKSKFSQSAVALDLTRVAETGEVSPNGLNVYIGKLNDPALSKGINRLVTIFAEKLGFIKPGEEIGVNNPRTPELVRNAFTIKHPDKAVSMQVNINGADGNKPLFSGFTIQHTPILFA